MTLGGCCSNSGCPKWMTASGQDKTEHHEDNLDQIKITLDTIKTRLESISTGW